MNKPKMKAHIKFCKFENALAMQVLYIDGRLTDSESLYNSNFYSISFSGSYRKLSIFEGVRIPSGWGWLNNCDVAIVTDIQGTYGGSIDYYMHHLINSFKNWAKNWEGWKDEPTIEPIINEYKGGVVEVMV